MRELDILRDSIANVPDSESGLECCLSCGIILSRKQWSQRDHEFCPNGCHGETTTEFSGVVSVMLPRQSWVARYNGKREQVPGVYALNIEN